MKIKFKNSPFKNKNTGWFFLFAALLGIVAVLSFAISLAIFRTDDVLNYKIKLLFLPVNALLFASVFCYIYVASQRLYYFLRRTDIRNSTGNVLGEKKISCIFIRSFLLNIVVWGLWFLTYFPGTGMNDTINALISPTGTSTQPLVYQVLIHRSVSFFSSLFHSTTLGYASIVFIQMVLMSYSVAWIIKWMAQRGIKKAVLYTVMLYYALSPVMGNYSIAIIKDTVFGICTMLLTVFLYEILTTHGKKLKEPVWAGALFLVLAIILLIRPNGNLVVWTTGLVLLLFLKQGRKISAVILASLLLITMGVRNLQNDYYSEQPSFQEMASVPLAQIGAVLKAGGKIDKEDQALLNQILPLDQWSEGYRFSFSDHIKFNPEFSLDQLNQRKADFIKTWLSVMKSNFPTYVKAYLYHSYGFWNISMFNPHVTSYSQSFFIKINNNTAEDSQWGRFLAQHGLQNQSVLPQPAYRFLNSFYEKAFIINITLSPGIMIWLIFGCGIFLMHAKRYRVSIIFLPTILTWMIMMAAAPGSLFYRYSFYLAMTLPCIIVITMLEICKEHEAADPHSY